MARCDLQADATAPHQARMFAERTFEQWGALMPADLPLAVSELVTNAVRHGCPPIHISLVEVSEEVLVEVCDSGGDPIPVTVAPHIDLTVPGGHGLRIVEAVSASWGSSGTDVNHCVWCRFPLR